VLPDIATLTAMTTRLVEDAKLRWLLACSRNSTGPCANATASPTPRMNLSEELYALRWLLATSRELAATLEQPYHDSYDIALADWKSALRECDSLPVRPGDGSHPMRKTWLSDAQLEQLGIKKEQLGERMTISDSEPPEEGK
jgi:proteasome lid subunit RPN8/RPN11